MFTIELELTKCCNLQCNYCFEIKDSDYIISYEEAIERIDFLLNGVGHKDIYVDFTGGEPLLAFETIRKVVMSLQSEQYYNYKFKFGLVTNGTLFDSEKKDFFEKYEFDLTISLDGNQSGHDINRIMKNGTGSYNSIIKNLALFKSYIKPVAINMIITNNNFEHFFDNFTSILELGFKIIRSKLDINSKWKKEDLELLNQELYKVADQYFEINKDGLIVYWDFIEEGLESISNIRSHYFCGAGIISLCITVDGTVRCCGMCENNGIIGNIKNGISEDDLKKISSYSHELPGRCLGCSIIDYCPQRDCVFLNQALSDDEEKLSKYCEWYKIRYEICRNIIRKIEEYRRIK